MQKVTPFLWFDTQAEEAANLYVSVIRNSRLGGIARYSKASARASGRPAGSVMQAILQMKKLDIEALRKAAA